MGKERIIVDFDNTMVNSSETIIKMLNWKNRHKTNNSMKYESRLLQWDFAPYAKTESDVEWCKSQFNNQRFYDELEPIEGCKEALKELHKKYEIVVCSSRGTENSEMFINYVHNVFGDLVDDIIILVDNFDKGKFTKGDIRIDDKIECLKDNGTYNILFGDYGYSSYDDWYCCCRAFNWNDVLKSIKEYEDLYEYYY